MSHQHLILVIVLTSICQTSSKLQFSHKPVKTASYLPKTLRSSDFTDISKQPAPKKEPVDLPNAIKSMMGDNLGGPLNAVIGEMLQKKPQGQMPNNKGKKPAHSRPNHKPASSTSTSQNLANDELGWIDTIPTDEALSLLEGTLKQQQAKINAQLARIATARQRLNPKSPPRLDKRVTTRDITEALFGDRAEEMKELGMHLQVVEFAFDPENPETNINMQDLMQAMKMDKDESVMVNLEQGEDGEVHMVFDGVNDQDGELPNSATDASQDVRGNALAGVPIGDLGELINELENLSKAHKPAFDLNSLVNTIQKKTGDALQKAGYSQHEVDTALVEADKILTQLGFKRPEGQSEEDAAATHRDRRSRNNRKHRKQ